MSTVMDLPVVAIDSVDRHGPEDLIGPERTLATRMSPPRLATFAGARACARTALERLGHARCPILPGRGGAPRWPPGIVGSMTHCEGYSAAAIAPGVAVSSLGIDAEPHKPLKPVVVPIVAAHPRERAQIEHLEHHVPNVAWTTVMFCAKEATYKAWWPLAGAPLTFADVHVTIAEQGWFRAELHPPAPAPTLHWLGRWAATATLIVTGVVVRAADLDGTTRHETT